MALSVAQVASSIVLAEQPTITATFANAIQQGETVGVIAAYLGTLGAGTCADGTGRNFSPGASVAGEGWTISTFYYENHPGGDTQITFTAPAAVTNKGLIAFRISSISGEIEFADSAVNIQAAPGTDTDAVTTGNMELEAEDGLIVGVSLNINAALTLSVGTDFTTQGSIWNDFALAESRAISTGPGEFAATWTTSGGGNTFVSGALAFGEVPPFDSGYHIDGATQRVLTSGYEGVMLYNDGQGNFFEIPKS